LLRLRTHLREGAHETVKLVTRGRVSGLPHVVELRFVVRDGQFFVIAGRRGSDWVKNLLNSQEAKLRLSDLVYTVRPAIASGSEFAQVLSSFSAKYGERIVKRWYQGSDICVRLEVVGKPSRRGAMRGEMDTLTGVREWVSSQRDYYTEVVRAFDSASEEYDFTISRNFINTWIRKRSIDSLLQYTRQEDALLEVGCGTGAEALEIAKHVRLVVATDISPKMVEILKAKVRARGLESRVIAARLPASEIHKASKLLPGGRARIAYSFNGALNCEPRLKEFAKGLASIIEPGGHFVCSVRNTLCLSEALCHALALQPERMNPRRRQPIMVSVGGLDLPSFYYQPSNFSRFFSPWFRTLRVVALLCVMPPAYLNNYYLKLGPVASLLRRVDEFLSTKPVFDRLGDQTLFVFQRS
jgi:SAM-dependent methyltransferase